MVDSATMPGEGDVGRAGDAGVVRLFRRGQEFAIRVDGRELMASGVHGSEDALACMAWERLRQAPTGGREPLCRDAAGKRGAGKHEPPEEGTADAERGPGRRKPPDEGTAEVEQGPRMLVGGLGMGYTLAAALAHAPEGAEVHVAEVVPAVVEWNRGPLAHLAGKPLDDERVTVLVRDVVEVIRESHAAYDVIALDVDNGPKWLARPGNEWLYSPAGLAAAFDALTGRGLLAVWSAGPDRSFASRLVQAGFEVEEVAVRARGEKGGRRHVIWFAGKTARGPHRRKR
jgi:hypothetical protein